MPSSIGMQLPQTRFRQRRRRAQKSLAENDPGVAVGQTAAAGILARRANDGRVPNPLPPPFTGENAIGMWRPTTSYQPPPPSSGAPMATP
jgi:hypothetical protein